MRAGVLALMCVCIAGPAAAQDRTVPRDFVLALFAHQMESDSANRIQILIGKAPDNLALPKLNLPVMGTLNHEYGATIVYRVTGDLKKAYSDVKELMRTAGWQPLRVPDSAPLDAGFIGTEVDVEDFMPFCRDDATAMFHTARIRSDLQVLRLDIHRMDGCHSTAMGWTQYTGPQERTPLPKLDPPRKAQVFGSATPGTISSFTTNAFVVSDMTTAQLMDHYGAQMHAAGWSSRGATTGEITSVHTWRVAREGKEWLASMTVTQLPHRRHVVEISVYNLSRVTR